jgi:hypothetical protein
MNFAWSNPVTGLREQTPHAYHPYFAGELGPLRQEARRRAWESLQADPEQSPAVEVYEQIRAGRVSAQMESDIDLIELMRAGWNQEDCDFAFCDPATGNRHIVGEWPGYLKEVLANDPSGSISEVIIYATRPAFIVKRDDPAPPALDPIQGREHPELDDLELIHREVANFMDLDGGSPAPKATALALIDIARSLRRLLGEFTPPPPDWSQMPKEPIEICTCTGDGLTADGAYCVCPTGMQRKRAAAVASRPAQEPR